MCAAAFCSLPSSGFSRRLGREVGLRLPFPGRLSCALMWLGASSHNTYLGRFFLLRWPGPVPAARGRSGSRTSQNSLETPSETVLSLHIVSAISFLFTPETAVSALLPPPRSVWGEAVFPVTARCSRACGSCGSTAGGTRLGFRNSSCPSGPRPCCCLLWLAPCV